MRAVDRATGKDDLGTGTLGLVGNIIWLILAGWWLALAHFVIAVVMFVTIIGIPFGWAHLKLAEGPQVARLGADSQPIFPPGLPFCRDHVLIYPTGTVRCERGGEDLRVICPMCGLGRPAVIDTCPNCGLVLQVKNHPVPVVRSTGPKPGGAAAA